MTAATTPSPQVALIELRAHISAGATISMVEAVRLTEIIRGSFAAWSDGAESTDELRIILLQEKLAPGQHKYALDLLEMIENVLPRKPG